MILNPFRPRSYQCWEEKERGGRRETYGNVKFGCELLEGLDTGGIFIVPAPADEHHAYVAPVVGMSLEQLCERTELSGVVLFRSVGMSSIINGHRDTSNRMNAHT